MLSFRFDYSFIKQTMMNCKNQAGISSKMNKTNKPLPSIALSYRSKLRVISYIGACQTLASSTKSCSTPVSDICFNSVSASLHSSLLNLHKTDKRSLAPSNDSCAFNNNGLASYIKNTQSMSHFPIYIHLYTYIYIYI